MKALYIFLLIFPQILSSQDYIETNRFFDYAKFEEYYSANLSFGSVCKKNLNESIDQYAKRTLGLKSSKYLKAYEFDNFGNAQGNFIVAFCYLPYNNPHPTSGESIEYTVLMGLIYVPTKIKEEYIIHKIGEWIPDCGWQKDLEDVFISNNKLVVHLKADCHRHGQWYSSFIYKNKFNEGKLELFKELGQRCDYIMIVDSSGNELDFYLGENDVLTKSYPCQYTSRRELIELIETTNE